MTFDLSGVEPNSDIEILFKAVGFVVVQWGCAEQTLDLIVSMVFPLVGPSKRFSKPPHFLKGKTEFLREQFENYSDLNQFNAESKTLLQRFEVAGNRRNDLVHGAITAFLLEDGVFKFSKIDIRKEDGHVLRTVLLDDSEWASFRKELLNLGMEGGRFAQKVWDVLNSKYVGVM
ncbi:MAG: hypothetical protein PHN84_07915 [Desulfuromonadaceae bacterium]|nr:hypothetical protein [Desulfuromonadaceae bacterium]MDD2854758.1 hypothetical protein [Desulfuromonadaceae bacterium]